MKHISRHEVHVRTACTNLAKLVQACASLPGQRLAMIGDDDHDDGDDDDDDYHDDVDDAYNDDDDHAGDDYHDDDD